MRSTHTINKKSRYVKNRADDGYSLIEMAIALIVIGLVMVPAIALYQVQVMQERVDDTETAVNSTTTAIGGFRSLRGRYPCPAPLDVPPGDVRYGLEDCTVGAPGSCANGICTTTSNRAGIGDILIGSLPFKNLNMQEFEAYDAYGHRLVYAVTNGLTDVSTFAMGAGGITIIDKAGDQMTDIPDSAHFTVISYGENPVGAYSKMGALSSPCAGVGDEIQNCDMDETFVFGEIEDGFDHHMDFFSSVSTSEWQVSETDAGDIHIKNTSNLAIGASLADDTSTTDDDLLTTESAAVRSTLLDEGKIRARQNFLSGNLCEYDVANPAQDCFSPSLIGGQLQDVAGTYQTSAAGIGMSCNDGFLVGIQNGQAVCSTDVVLTCPAGDFLVGVNNAGEIICNSEPIGCEATDVTSWCGETLTIPATFDGGYNLTYSGECYEITDYDAAYFTTAIAGLSYTEIGDLIETINNEPRTQIACNTPDNFNSQIRETYQCTSGTFNHIVAHEKRYSWYNFTPNVSSTSSSYRAEVSTDPYEPYGGPLSPSGGTHDCWCREDYRVAQASCGTNFTGNRTIIYKHSCPQTYNRFQAIFTSDVECACAGGTSIQYQSCSSYYNDVNGTNISSGALSGTVELTYGITCNANTPVTSANPISVDTSDCSCIPNGPYSNYSYCSQPGTTNQFSWSWPGLGTNNVKGVENISISEYVCPGTTTGGLPDPGSWVYNNYSPIPACTCDSNRTDDETIACADGLQGTGLVYEKEWDCTANGGMGDWEPQSEWELIEDNCSSCSWQKPSGTPEFSEYALGSLIGSTCSCGIDPAPLCRDYTSGGYDIWNNCQCVVQNN